MGLFDMFKKKDIVMPNFEEIDSNEKAMEYVKKGVLHPLYLMPLRFNGVDSIENTLFVPKVAVELKDRVDDMVENLLRQGKVTGYSCTPEYKGKSFVPCKLTVEANMKGEPILTETINIW